MNSRNLLPSIVLLGLFCATALSQVQTMTLPAVKDNTLYESTTGLLSNGAGAHMFAGRTGTGAIRRAVLAFDIAGNLPAGATVLSANLTLFVTKTAGGPANVSLRAALADWGEAGSVAPGQQGSGGLAQPGDVTWIHTFSPGSFWAASGGDFAPFPSATTFVGGIGSYAWNSNSDMVADVQGWLDNPASSWGWFVIGDEGGNGTAKRFATRQNNSVGNRPALTITYDPNTAASAVPTGTGCVSVGAGGDPFRLRATGVPALGNSGFQLTYVNGLPTSQISTYLATGLAPAPVPLGSCQILLDIPSAQGLIDSGVSPVGPFPSLPGGGFTLPVPIPNDPGLSGAALDLQAISFSAVGFVTSNALTLNFL